MAHNIVHFAVHADDVPRARAFYENVFGWVFKPWGPPDFYLITTGLEGDPGIHGALQKRVKPADEGGLKGYECTVSVQDLSSISSAIKANGGGILMEETEIPNVGNMIQFQDTEGNIACAMKYNLR